MEIQIDHDFIVAPHVRSFNYCLTRGLENMCKRLNTLECKFKNQDEYLIEIRIQSLEVEKPCQQQQNTFLYPKDCRLAKQTYSGNLKANVQIIQKQQDREQCSWEELNLGQIPIMVKSVFCNLNGEKDMKKFGEDEIESGGYFIYKGYEKLIRLIIATKSNYPIALSKDSFKKKGTFFTPMSVQVRCIRDDFFTLTNTFHYKKNGSIALRFSYNRIQQIIPVSILLKALKEIPNKQIYQLIVRGETENYIMVNGVEELLMQLNSSKIQNQQQALDWIGNSIQDQAQNIFPFLITQNKSTRELGELFIQEFVLVHLQSFEDKFNMCIICIDKLYQYATQKIKEDNLDALSNQEAILPGQVYLMLLKDKIERQLLKIKEIVQDKYQMQFLIEENEMTLHESILYVLQNNLKVGMKLDYFIATGTAFSSKTLDLPQNQGFTIFTEKYNILRFLSHFRSIHRGQRFQNAMSNKLRQLLPESFGFICPVNTPDGASCGILNHLSQSCEIVCEETQIKADIITQYLDEKYLANQPDFLKKYSRERYPVCLNGALIGCVKNLEEFQEKLRNLKRQMEYRNMEIA